MTKNRPTLPVAAPATDDLGMLTAVADTLRHLSTERASPAAAAECADALDTARDHLAVALHGRDRLIRELVSASEIGLTYAYGPPMERLGRSVRRQTKCDRIEAAIAAARAAGY